MSPTAQTVRLVRAAQPAEPAPLTAGQLAVLESCRSSRGALLVTGGPGSGKTTVMVAAAVDQVRAGLDLSRVVVLTGSRAAAQQLRARLVAALGASQRGLQVTTVHGWCAQLLRRFAEPGRPAPRLLTGPEQEFRVRELIAGWPRDSWPAQLDAAVGTRGFAREVRHVIARARQLGFDPEQLAGAGRAAGLPEWESVARFYLEYQDVLDAEGVIDYAELVLRTRLALLDERVATLLPDIAPVVFCDEFAEYDPGMIELLAQVHQVGSRVVAMADPSTRVFGFRGADRRAVADFATRFDRPGEPVQRLELTQNVRCASGVADAVRLVSGRLPAEVGSGRPPAPVARPADGDAVSAVVLPDETAQAMHVAALLRRAHVVGGVPWDEMAVITRSGGKAVSTLARRLAAAGVPVRVAGDEVALSDEVAVRHLLAVLAAAVELAEGRGLDEVTAGRLLRGPIGGLDAIGVRRAGRELRQRSAGSQLSSEQLLAAELATESLVPTADEASVTLRAVARLRATLAGLAEEVTKGTDVTTLLWRAWNGTNWPGRLQAEALGGGENSQRAHRDLDAVVALFDLAQRGLQWSGASGVRALVAEVAQQQIPADTTRESDPRDSAVPVLTVHRSKGMQWRLVVLAGLQEGSWPALPGAAGLLRSEQLTADGLLTTVSPGEHLADERRAFLLAISRASERVVATAIADPAGQVEPPSRFLGELGVKVVVPDLRRTPTTLPELVAELRRVATDPASAPGLAQQAAGELAWLAAQTDDSGRALAPGSDPAAWWGLRSRTLNTEAVPSQPIRLSSSEVTGLLDCPRKWFCSRQAKADPARGSQATFGSLIHALIEQATGGVGPDELQTRLDEIWPRLRFGADYQSITERAAATQILERFAVWAGNGDHDRVLGTEVAFDVPLTLDGRQVNVVGKVDRLELDARGRLRVIDFKTGRSAASVSEAAQMDQLGIYQLAARLGAFDEISGGVRELSDAEVVYLRVGTRSGGPTSRTQPSLDSQPRLDEEAPAEADRTWVHDRLSEAAEIVATERYVARNKLDCARCPFLIGCPAHLEGVEPQ